MPGSGRHPKCIECLRTPHGSLGGQAVDGKMQRLYTRSYTKGITGGIPVGWICNFGHTIITRAPVFLTSAEKVDKLDRQARKHQATSIWV